MSNDEVETRIETLEGEISFQEYFVKQRWQPEVKKVSYAGAEKSHAAPGVLEAIHDAAKIVICPSNPVTSIGPVLAIPGVRNALIETNAPVVAVSPMIGESAISGPAHKLMAAQGINPSAFGVAKGYAGFLDQFVIDRKDEQLRHKIESLGIKTVATSVMMQTLDDKRRLACEVLALFEK